MSNNPAHWEVGVSGNPNGRPVGTKNKTPQFVRNAIALILEDNVERLRDEMSCLEGKQLIDSFIALADFVIPRRQRIHISDVEEGEKKIQTFRIGDQIISFTE